MTKGPAGYGRYADDPSWVGCPWARSDMTPCIARDGHLALSSGAERVCVGCNHTPEFLIRDLAAEYEPARSAQPPQAVFRSGEEADRAGADWFRDRVREATEPGGGEADGTAPAG